MNFAYEPKQNFGPGLIQRICSSHCTVSALATYFHVLVIAVHNTFLE